MKAWSGRRKCHGCGFAAAATILTFGLALSAAGPACAGAWLQPEGRGQIIFSPSAMVAAQRFDRRGRVARTDRFVKQDTQTTVEYGAQRGLTLMLGLGTRTEAYPLPGAVQRVMTSSFSGGARLRLWEEGGAVVSAQVRASTGFERSLPGLERRFGARHEADIRLLAGYSFEIGGLPAFVEAQAGYRWRSGARGDEAVADLAVGLRPTPRLQVIAQLFAVAALQGDGYGAAIRPRHAKAQISAVFDLTETWSVQAGAFASVAGREALREQGALIAIWRRF
jgi:protein XagA